MEVKVGDRIRLIWMKDDPDPIVPGSKGTVTHIDDLEQIIVKWDSGRTLSLIPGIDEYTIIEDENVVSEHYIKFKSLEQVKDFNQFKLIQEIGEWPKDVNLRSVEDNPDADDEFSNWIRQMWQNLISVKKLLEDGILMDILSIRGFDAYQGPYATITIRGKNDKSGRFDVWGSGQTPGIYWIEDFPFSNTTEGERDGFVGGIEDMAKAINIFYTDRYVKQINK